MCDILCVTHFSYVIHVLSLNWHEYWRQTLHHSPAIFENKPRNQHCNENRWIDWESDAAIYLFTRRLCHWPSLNQEKRMSVSLQKKTALKTMKQYALGSTSSVIDNTKYCFFIEAQSMTTPYQYIILVSPTKPLYIYFLTERLCSHMIIFDAMKIDE